VSIISEWDSWEAVPSLHVSLGAPLHGAPHPPEASVQLRGFVPPVLAFSAKCIWGWLEQINVKHLNDQFEVR